MKNFKELFQNKEKKTVLNFIIMLLIGIMLIVTSNIVFEKKEEKEVKQTLSEENIETKTNFTSQLETRLKNALMNVYGVGEVDVMITVENQGEIVVAEDNIIDKSETNDGQNKYTNNLKEEKKKVLLESNKPLVLKEIQPKVQGVLVIARGGGSVEIKQSIIKAVQALLNVETHKIEVLKMK